MIFRSSYVPSLVLVPLDSDMELLLSGHNPKKVENIATYHPTF